MKVSNQTQSQLDRLAKTGSFSTNKPILDEIVVLYKEVTGLVLDPKCGTCVKNAMYSILKAQKAPKADAGGGGNTTTTKAPAKTADPKVVAPVIGKDFDGKKQFSDAELKLCKLEPLQNIAKAMNLEGWNTKTTKAVLVKLITEAYAKPAPKAEAPKAPAKVEEVPAEKTTENENAATSENENEGSDDGDGNETMDHVVTEEDLAENAELAENGVKVGDTIQVAIPPKEEE